jgi:hypothetical protein
MGAGNAGAVRVALLRGINVSGKLMKMVQP